MKFLPPLGLLTGLPNGGFCHFRHCFLGKAFGAGVFDRLQAVFPEFANIHLFDNEDVLEFDTEHVTDVIVAHGLASADCGRGLNIDSELSTFEQIWSPDIEDTQGIVDVNGFAFSLSNCPFPELAHGVTKWAANGFHLLTDFFVDGDHLAHFKGNHNKLQFMSPTLNHDFGSFGVGSHVEFSG